jgi:hypothetical protein
MLRVPFLFVAIAMLLCQGEAAAQLTVDHLYPGREVSATAPPEETTIAIRTPEQWPWAETSHTPARDLFLATSRSNTPMGMGTGTEPAVGKFSIVGAVVGTLVGGGIGYLVVHADERTSNFWEIGPLVVVPAGAAGFFLGGAIGGIITKPGSKRR